MSRLFNVSNVFIAIVAVVLFLFGSAAYESVATKLGFETKTSLRQKLADANATISTLKAVNEENLKELSDLRKKNKDVLKELEDLTDQKQVAEQKSKQLQEQLRKKSKDLLGEVKRKKVDDGITITLPKKEIDALSELNIDMLNDAFDQFFPTQGASYENHQVDPTFALDSDRRFSSLGLRIPSQGSDRREDPYCLCHSPQELHQTRDAWPPYGALTVPESAT